MKAHSSSRNRGTRCRVKSRPSLRHPRAVRLARILVPIDFSPLSQKALKYAIALAESFDARICLLHVVEPVPVLPTDLSAPLAPGTSSQPGRERALKRLVTMREDISTVPVETEVRGGIPSWEILNATRELNCDLVIMGTHGRTGLAHLLMGSTAERVVRHAPCPVMVIRERERDFIGFVSGESHGLSNYTKRVAATRRAPRRAHGSPSSVLPATSR